MASLLHSSPTDTVKDRIQRAAFWIIVLAALVIVSVAISGGWSGYTAGR